MPSKRTRDRQLAKLAARRQAERLARARRRRMVAGVVGALIGVAAIVVGLNIFFLDDQDVAAGPSATKSPGGRKTPQQIGTVLPQAEPPAKVACGGERPAAADRPKPQFDRAPSARTVIEDGIRYTAVMETSCGTIEIELNDWDAPETVASFVFLARQGYFDGLTFHRVVDSIDVIQGGDPLGTGGGGPGYTIPDELLGSESYVPGTVAMAKTQEPNSGGSQFFIITGPDGRNLDPTPNYTIFGKVISGLDVAKRINALMEGPGYDGPPTQAVYIESVTIEEGPEPSPTPTASG